MKRMKLMKAPTVAAALLQSVLTWWPPAAARRDVDTPRPDKTVHSSFEVLSVAVCRHLEPGEAGPPGQHALQAQAATVGVFMSFMRFMVEAF
jgi:hypothetical protein